MDLQFEDPRPRYRLSQTGFALIALALGLLCVDAGCWVALMFTGNPAIHGLLTRPEWTWLVGAPITWASLVGSLFLLGRWSEASWRQRAGWLVVLNTVDLVQWGLAHAKQLGLAENAVGHDWLRQEISGALGWIELALIAGLATQVSEHLGKVGAHESGRSARSFALVGAALWAVIFLTQTQWNHWPLLHRPFRPRQPQGLLMLIGSYLILTITSFQVTVLCLIASRQCRRYVHELDRHESDHDLLRSRSEVDKDDPFWGG